MRRSQIYFIAVILLLIIVLFGFQYFFSIYEVDISVEPKVLYTDNSSECVIRTVPLNSFGMEIPFRKASADIEIMEGLELIEVIELDEQNGRVRIRAKDKTGTVVIYIKPENALLPSSIEIKIIPNIA